MLFYVQMKWNYQGRIPQEELWALEQEESIHGLEGIRSGFVQLYKVVSQHRIIAIVESDSLDDLDRNSMGWLPMREYLEFEEVWALRDYESFAFDVVNRFSQNSGSSILTVKEVAELWFHSLQKGEFDKALSLIHNDVTWENIAPVEGITDIAPWLGSYKGLDDVKKSFDVWAQYSEMLSFVPGDIHISADNAVSIVHEHARCLANGNEYDLYVSTHLKIQGGKIIQWKVFWDPSPLVSAYTR